MKNSLYACTSGELRHQVQIQRRSTVPDTDGGELESWTTIRTAMARILTAGMRDAFQSGQFSAQVTHIVTLRCNVGDPEILPGMQVLFGTHAYIVQAIDNVRMQNVWLNLMCLEINGGQ